MNAVKVGAVDGSGHSSDSPASKAAKVEGSCQIIHKSPVKAVQAPVQVRRMPLLGNSRRIARLVSSLSKVANVSGVQAGYAQGTTVGSVAL